MLRREFPMTRLETSHILWMDIYMRMKLKKWLVLVCILKFGYILDVKSNGENWIQSENFWESLKKNPLKFGYDSVFWRSTGIIIRVASTMNLNGYNQFCQSDRKLHGYAIYTLNMIYDLSFIMVTYNCLYEMAS